MIWVSAQIPHDLLDEFDICRADDFPDDLLDVVPVGGKGDRLDGVGRDLGQGVLHNATKFKD